MFLQVFVFRLDLSLDIKLSWENWKLFPNQLTRPTDWSDFRGKYNFCKKAFNYFSSEKKSELEVEIDDFLSRNW